MSDKTIIALIEATLDEKIEQNEDFIRYSYYELNVKYDNILPKEIKGRFIKLLKNKLEICIIRYIYKDRFLNIIMQE